MIPKQLILRNFLSYRDAALNFEGLQVACVSGPNGAGKSSLLEAIIWAIWGQSRAAVDDDVIHLGELEAHVDFTFEHQQHLYRVLRSRQRQQGGTLEFQVQMDQGFRSLTQRGMRATQQLINQALRLDYDTFINSAYLRQGRADEFMLKRPSERKQILADLLKLDQYDLLAERAKERAREAKAQVGMLATTMANLEEQLRPHEEIVQTAQAVEITLVEVQAAQHRDQRRLQDCQQQQQQRQQWQQTQALWQQQFAHQAEESHRLDQEQIKLQQHLDTLEQTLSQAEAIQAGVQLLKTLEAKDEQLSAQLGQLQNLQARRDRLKQRHQEQLQSLRIQMQQGQLSLTNLDQQIAELTPVLDKREQMAGALAELQKARHQLATLDALQLQTSPLKQRQQTLLRHLDHAQAELSAQLSALESTEAQLQQQQAQYPHLQQAVLEVGQTLEDLAQRRLYQEKVREKGIERRQFMEQLQTEQRSCERQLAHLEHQVTLLNQPEAQCPVCDRPLDQPHREHVLVSQHQEQEEIQQRIWVIREQLAVSDREIQVLRQEYRDLEAALTHYGQVLEHRGQLMAQLQTHESVLEQLQTLAQQRSHLAGCLANQTYAQDAQLELQQITAQLAQLAYDERDHALARGQVDRLRWADIRQAEIRQAERKHTELVNQRPQILHDIETLEAEITALEQSDVLQQLAEVETQITTLGYSLEQHQELRAQIRTAQDWALHYQRLVTAQQDHSQVKQQLVTLNHQHQQLQQQQANLTQQLQAINQQLDLCLDLQPEITTLQASLRDLQQQREQALSQAGALQQQLQHYEQLQAQLGQLQQEYHQALHRLHIHQELAHAFGRNGLQALLIEQMLPQLEAETNHILGRLSAHQLHVQFVTQRAGRGRQTKVIETLDIVIADAQGTRPYETYSGGEAFRVNFAIRLALARTLAQRSGAPLQTLIIDEGFGTQDHEGCDRLIGAINAIASDFACILAVTHIPHFREAFQTRVDVFKTPEGSRLSISM